MIRAAIAKAAVTAATAFLTERFMLNALVILAEWAVQRWGNDLTAELFEQFKEALDKDSGQSFNLYDEVRDLRPTTRDR